ncbi:MAG: non-canonical purine NTP pyrophosphatase [Candidatus Levybacteria bacterium]|nr:non-canonical purine NTP pyrophosphatase [Candidatus Levybacteria bacterium]
MEEISYITSNPHKAAHMSRLLNSSFSPISLAIPEIQSLDIDEVIREKAKAAYEVVKKPLFVDDISLTIHALGKLPGPFIKFFLSEIGADSLCRMISDERSALGEAALGYHDGQNIHIFHGQVKGKIAEKEMSENGFGWDRIFIPEGFSITRGEMSSADYDLTSPRRIALEKFRSLLNKKSAIADL